MSDPVTFATDQLGRTEARMGERLVGMIETWPEPTVGSFSPNAPVRPVSSVRAFYEIYLPVDTPRKRPASSVAAARRGLLQWLAGWFIEAGPHCEAIAEAIGRQALAMSDLAA